MTLYAIPTLNIPDSSYDYTRTATNRLITDPSIYVTAPVRDTSEMCGIYLAINEPTTLRFIAHVITQVVRELTGSSYFHFDSDEAHALTYMGATYQRYVEKITQIIRSKGVTPINWNESVADKQQPGVIVQLCNGDHA